MTCVIAVFSLNHYNCTCLRHWHNGGAWCQLHWSHSWHRSVNPRMLLPGWLGGTRGTDWTQLPVTRLPRCHGRKRKSVVPGSHQSIGRRRFHARSGIGTQDFFRSHRCSRQYGDWLVAGTLSAEFVFWSWSLCSLCLKNSAGVFTR